MSQGPPAPGGASRSERLYARLLGLYPAAYRREYGPLMLQLFRDLERDARRAGSAEARLGLWGTVLGELAQTAGAEHVEAWRRAMKTDAHGRMSPARPMSFLLSAVLIALGLLGGAVLRANGGPPVVAALVAAGANLLAAVVVDLAAGAGGFVLAMMGVYVASIFAPLMWVTDSAQYLRQNPVAGMFILIAAFYLAPRRRRWPLVVVTAIMAGAQLLASLL